MHVTNYLLVLAASVVTAQQISRDPGASGPVPEIVHLYNDEWPTGKKSVCQSL